MVIGSGYDDPSVIVHETNHAMATVNGTSADASTLLVDRRELRATGRDVGEQPLERWFD